MVLACITQWFVRPLLTGKLALDTRHLVRSKGLFQSRGVSVISRSFRNISNKLFHERKSDKLSVTWKWQARSIPSSPRWFLTSLDSRSSVIHRLVSGLASKVTGQLPVRRPKEIVGLHTSRLESVHLYRSALSNAHNYTRIRNRHDQDSWMA